MEILELQVGGIYRNNMTNEICRIIGFDEYTVHYDGYWELINKWTFSGNFKSVGVFHGALRKFFPERYRQIDYLPLTEEEHLMFRPDLPIALCLTNELSWNAFKIDNYNSFKEQISTFQNISFLKRTLQANKIVLLPYGKKGGTKSGKLISADNNQFFESAELIWKAKEIQETVNNEISNGIGFFRSGYEKRVPSYYIKQYYKFQT